MKNIWFVLAASTLLFSCDAPSNSSSDPLLVREVTAELSSAKSFALNPTANSWPQSTDSVVLSKDLLRANYYMVLDGSGSMNEHRCSGNQDKLHAAKDAIEIFTQAISKDANLGLLVFDNQGISERVSLSHNNRPDFQNALRSVVANKGTPLNSAIDMAYRSLTRQAQKQLGYGEYHLIVVTDGEANKGEDPNPIVSQILIESPVQVHTIGFCIEGGHSLNQPGKINYKQANNPASLAQSLKEVLAESPSFDTQTFEGQQ